MNVTVTPDLAVKDPLTSQTAPLVCPVMTTGSDAEKTGNAQAWIGIVSNIRNLANVEAEDQRKLLLGIQDEVAGMLNKLNPPAPQPVPVAPPAPPQPDPASPAPLPVVSVPAPEASSDAPVDIATVIKQANESISLAERMQRLAGNWVPGRKYTK